MAKTINYNGVRIDICQGLNAGFLLFSVAAVSNHCLAGTDNCHPNATCTSLPGPTFKCACKEEMNYFGNGTHCFGKSYRYMWFFNFSPRCSNSRCFLHVFATYVLSSFVSFASERKRDCSVFFLRYFKPTPCWACVYLLFSKCKGSTGSITARSRVLLVRTKRSRLQ